MERYDAIVVGVGAMGSAACYHLARRGAKVLGLEQFDIPHSHGSSTGFSRMTRLAYYEHPDYVPLLKSAFRLWHELELVSGHKLIYLTGGLYLGREDGELVGGSLQAARQHKLAHEMLAREELARRFPQFTPPEDFVGLLEHDAGFIVPERAVAAHAMAALGAGAEIRGRERVVQWSGGDGDVSVSTERGSYRAKTLLFCGGAWSDRLVSDLGISLRVTRQVMGWVWPKQPALFEAGTLPVWAIDHLDGTIHYGFPISSESPGLKLAHHGPAALTSPDEVDRQISAADEQTFRPVLRQMIPAADGAVLSIRTCLYTNSPDGHFILDRHPRHSNVLLACGFSGHGFKFAPVIGQAMAELALEGRTLNPVDFLGLGRFRGRA